MTEAHQQRRRDIKEACKLRGTATEQKHANRWQTVGKSSANRRQIDGKSRADGRQVVGKQSANRSANRRQIVGRPSTILSPLPNILFIVKTQYFCSYFGSIHNCMLLWPLFPLFFGFSMGAFFSSCFGRDSSLPGDAALSPPAPPPAPAPAHPPVPEFIVSLYPHLFSPPPPHPANSHGTSMEVSLYDDDVGRCVGSGRNARSR